MLLLLLLLLLLWLPLLYASASSGLAAKKAAINNNLTTSNSSSSLRFPLIRHRAFNGRGDEYLLQLLIGQVSQKEVLLQLDSRNEGLRLFIPPRGQLQEFVGGYKVNDKDGYDPFLSTSLKWCLSGQPCLFSLSGGPGSYSCDKTSQDPHEGQFFNYTDLQPSGLLPTNLCEERAEATELVEIPSKDDGETNPRTLRLWDAPIKLVSRLFLCSNSTSKTKALDDFGVDALSSTEPELREGLSLESLLKATFTWEREQLLPKKASASTSSIQRGLVGQNDLTVDGILGIAGPTCRTKTFFNLTLRESGMSIVGFDFTPSDSPFISLSRSLPIGSPTYWSEPRQPLLSDVQGIDFFLSYDWQICGGVDLGYNQSSQWGAEIDLNTPCLGLPTPLWNAVMSWIPVRCPRSSNTCYLSNTYDPKQRLPALSFALSPNIRTHGKLKVPSSSPSNVPRIEISLDNLIIRGSSPDDELCIERVRGANEMDDESQESSSSSFPSIKFGTMVLRHLAFFIDHDVGRVGLRPSLKSIREPSDSACVTKKLCKGQESYYPPMNVCLSPICNAWMFKSLDQETGYCAYAPSALWILYLIVPILAIADFLSNIFYWKTVQFAKHRSR